MIFPNVGFTLGTIYIAEELESNAIEWVGVGMILVLALLWMLDVSLMGRVLARAVFQKSRVGP